METKHTPGPWRAAWNANRNANRLWAGVDCGDEQDPHRAEVCTVCVENIKLDDDEAWDRAKADVRLIAAAPALLAACEAVVNAWDYGDLAAAARQCQAAIAAAKGGEA